IITMDVADCMMNTPHRPHLKPAPQALERFIILDYPQYYPVAPGVVLIRSPGHSPDSQMVFIRLQSGREILHSVDSAWIMEQHHGGEGQGRAVGEGRRAGGDGTIALAQGRGRDRKEHRDSRDP